MKYIHQFLIIVAFTFVGEMLALLLPLPIPAAVYGLVLLFVALETKLVRLKSIQTCSNWLISILGIMFVAPTVNILSAWAQIAPNLVAIVAIVILTTILTFAASGIVTRLLTRKEDRHD